MKNRPVVAAAPPEALIIVCTREEVAGRGDDDYGDVGHGRNNNNKPPRKVAKKTGDGDLDPDAATNDDGGVYEDNDDDAEGNEDEAEPITLVKLEEGSDVKVIGGSYRGRQGTVVGIIQMSGTGGDNSGIQKYRVQLVPMETTHRPTTAAPRKQATGESSPSTIMTHNHHSEPIQHQLPFFASCPKPGLSNLSLCSYDCYPITNLDLSRS